MNPVKTPNIRRPQRINTLPRLTGFLVVALTLVLPGCINWSDAPMMHRHDNLEGGNRGTFDTAFPKAKLASAVYHLQMEDGGGYHVVSEQFLFRSENGQLHYGEINRAGKFTEREVTFIKALPDNLAGKLIRGPDAPLANAVLVSGPWTFTDNGMRKFQFEFTLGERAGLCTTDSDGTNRQVHFFVNDSQGSF